jgi:SAM-dependent methyltransferase
VIYRDPHMKSHRFLLAAMSSPANLSAQFPYTRKQLTPHDPSDVNFYASPRFVNHIDDHAISALSAFYENALPQGRILDICSSWVSHISPKHLGSQRIIGVGMNAKELEANPVLNGWAVHDLNREPYFFQSLWGKLQPGKRDRLIDENKFDAVICNVSIDYLSSPLEVTEGMADALQPGGWAYMVISNRCFPTKVGFAQREHHHCAHYL